MNNNNVNGFTLIEMLLALAIFAYSASAILGVLSQSARNSSSIEQMTFASWVANDRLVELQVEQQWPPKNKHKGEREMAGKVWYWHQVVEKTQDDNLRAVTTNVSTEKSGKNIIYSITTYVSKTHTSSGLGNG